ncbi:5-oxoprolinase (ATP-hydrolyzing) [Halosimplex carlsbadense 2-9-1]|uniref:5-oxoprolinase (ATP-hydrolyzing) n=1 Tax=Halosimplex carlsbadense 2-9-1 TaxID=797114 RepID=M0D732_9EURY|nr:hydantoinase/oxoprolinase family protein [Halosimplex carlsbadense]ELZ30482.1 5-oxoprolinase (ATP-hydrolyzing) [Halosimplex carlsbadense 2-9-1]
MDAADAAARDADASDAADARLGVDVGGTFTDVALVVDGDLTTAKVPTTDDQSRGVLAGIETACEAAGIDPNAVVGFRHATTAAVNAVLEGSGAETALVTTEGFADALAIGRQDRPDLYDRSARKPDPLVPAERRFEVTERATTEGIETTVDRDEVRGIADILDGNCESVAVSFLHAYAHPDNERRAAETLREELGVPVSVSHEVLAAFREYERTATTVADAYVTPVVDDYLGRLTERAADMGLPPVRVMQSNGGIADAATVRERAVTTLLSGPAAGVVGAARFERSDHAGLVTFDMGGTSSDVSLVREGSAERTTDAEIGGHPVGVPMVDVHTVGAGGGSIARVDEGGALRVGPESAGADPGPACYGKGGTVPTVTDAAVVLGYLGADTTLGEGLELDADRAEAVMEDLADEAGLDTVIDAAQGVYRVANATMARAIRGVTVERGHDPREFALAAFGGAGPMHAATLADRLGVETVLVPPGNGVLSALGLLAADERHDATRTYRAGLADADAGAVESVFDELAEETLAETGDPEVATVEREVECRYAGQSFELAVDAPAPFDPDTVRERFHDEHERARGYRMDEPVDLVTCRATATVPGDPPDLSYDPEGDPLLGKRDVFFESGFYRAPVYDRARVPVGVSVDGPAVFAGGESTVVVPPQWTARADAQGTLVLEAGEE